MGCRKSEKSENCAPPEVAFEWRPSGLITKWSETNTNTDQLWQGNGYENGQDDVEEVTPIADGIW